MIKSGESVEPKRAPRGSRAKVAAPEASKGAAERPAVAAVVGGAGVRGKGILPGA